MSFFDSTEITREVQIDVFHWNDLRVTTTGGSSFDSKYRAK